MSKEAARAFLSRLRDDEVFAQRIFEYKGPEDLWQVMYDSGYDFTAVEVKEAEAELMM